MTVIIQHEGREPSVYKDIVGIDFIDKEACERAADRQLSNEELLKIEHAISGCEYFPTETELRQIIEEIEED